MTARDNFIFGFLFFCISILGCESKKDLKSIIKIRSFEDSSPIQVNDCQLIKFQINSTSSLASIEKIITNKNRLYILDKIIGNSIFVYNYDGKFINTIHRVGEGPGEYKNIDNMFFNEEMDQLILTPMEVGKRIHFDRDGNFLYDSIYDQNLILADYARTNLGELFINKSHFNGEDNLQIWKNDKRTASFFPFDNYLDNSPLNQRNLLSKKDFSKFNFALGLRDTLYSIELKNNKISPEFIFDFGNKISFYEFAKHPNPIQYFMENDFYVGIIDIFQNDDFLTFSSLSNSGLQGRILSKQTRKIYSTNDLIQQKVGKLRFEGILALSNDKRFIAVIGKDHTIDWDFSKNPALESQVKKLGALDPEELLLLVFDFSEN